MRFISSALVILVLTHVSSLTAAPRLHTEEVRVKGPTIIAFVPSDSKNSQEEGAIEGAAHLRFAITGTPKCVSPLRPKVYLLYADVISVQNGRNSRRFEAHRLGQSVSAILVEPGRGPEVTYSVEGPSTLQYLLRQAAHSYWAAIECRQ